MAIGCTTQGKKRQSPLLRLTSFGTASLFPSSRQRFATTKNREVAGLVPHHNVRSFVAFIIAVAFVLIVSMKDDRHIDTPSHHPSPAVQVMDG
jgi:hypothetical protein